MGVRPTALIKAIGPVSAFPKICEMHPSKAPSALECPLGSNRVINSNTEPASKPLIIAQKADLQADSGDLTGAISTYSSALEKSPDDFALLLGRGIAYARSGDTAHADADFQRARGQDADPGAFNNMCWEKATAGVALDSALADCNAALAATPDGVAYLDSRGFVLLRMGRLDDAIADYNRALAKSPNMSSSLFGRAVAWARKGDQAKSQTDAAAAAKIDPDVRADFERYGVKL